MKWLFEGGRVICPTSGLDEMMDVLVEDERISAVGGFDPDGVDAERVDCSGKIIAPGLIDLEPQLCDPGMTWREDIQSGSRAAAAGGFTTLLVSPRTDPVLDDPTLIRELLERARREAVVEILASGALTVGLKGEEIAEVGLLVEAGARALSNADSHVTSTSVLRNALLYSRPFGRPVILRVGDPWLDIGGVVHEGEVSTHMGLRGIPDANEEIGLSRLVALCRITGATIHAMGISTARGVEVLRRAREEGVDISGSAGATHLLINEQSIIDSEYDTALKLSPPLRTEADRLALVEAVQTGVISAVNSQHVPWTRVEKELEFELAEAGMVGLETALSATVEALGDLGLAIGALSRGPAALLGERRAIEPGAVADLLVLDYEARWKVDSAAFASKCRSTPLEGRTLPVEVLTTLCRGKAVHRTQMG